MTVPPFPSPAAKDGAAFRSSKATAADMLARLAEWIFILRIRRAIRKGRI